MSQTFLLSAVSDEETNSFSLSCLRGKQYYKVMAVSKIFEYVKVVCEPTAELAAPQADPLILGTVIKLYVSLAGPVEEYEARIVWNNRLWRILENDVVPLLDMLRGITPEHLKELDRTLKHK